MKIKTVAIAAAALFGVCAFAGCKKNYILGLYKYAAVKLYAKRQKL